MVDESTELTVSTIRKIRGLMDYLKALNTNESIIFYLVSQVIDLISADPFLANGFIEDSYADGDWKFLWEELLSRFDFKSSSLVKGEF